MDGSLEQPPPPAGDGVPLSAAVESPARAPTFVERARSWTSGLSVVGRALLIAIPVLLLLSALAPVLRLNPNALSAA